MAETTDLNLDGVAETLLITLYIRAMESQRPDALIKDELAEALLTKLDYDFSRIQQIKMDEDDKTGIILRNREFDRYTQDFLDRHPQGVVVHIGCGLDSRFERVDNGAVRWYGLDLPDVIEIRRRFIGGEKERYQLLGCSVFDKAWLETVRAQDPSHYLFLAEGVFMYFDEAQVKSLVLRLLENFPGAELVFDAYSPYLVWANNLRLSFSKFGARYNWGLKRGEVLESWDPGIRKIDSWGFFDRPEPRLAHSRWMRHIPLLANVLRIYHFQLGNAG